MTSNRRTWQDVVAYVIALCCLGIIPLAGALAIYHVARAVIG